MRNASLCGEALPEGRKAPTETLLVRYEAKKAGKGSGAKRIGVSCRGGTPKVAARSWPMSRYLIRGMRFSLLPVFYYHHPKQEILSV